MMDIQEVFPGVLEMHTSYGRDTAGLLTDGAFPHAVWYVEGPKPALLDPGPSIIVEETLQTLRDLGYDPGAIEYIVPSHIHVDHGGGSGSLTRALPKAKVLVHSRGAPYIINPERLIAGTAQVFGEEWESVFGPVLPVPEDRLISVEDGFKISMGGRPYEIIFMPGHSLDHIGVYDETNRALYCGHGLGNYMPHRFMPDPPMTLPYFDVTASLESIQRARELAPRYLLPVHTGFLASNPAFAIDSVERVTVELGDIVRGGIDNGATLESIEQQVLEYFFADPRRADRSYMPVVQAYATYYERERRRGERKDS
jgi:glyoxylase-like metal-dependent hydrolase (beta-lactamase superfamily II)